MKTEVRGQVDVVVVADDDESMKPNASGKNRHGRDKESRGPNLKSTSTSMPTATPMIRVVISESMMTDLLDIRPMDINEVD